MTLNEEMQNGREERLSKTSCFLGLLSLVCCGLTAIPAIWVGKKAPKNPISTVGIIAGYVGLIIFIFFLLYVSFIAYMIWGRSRSPERQTIEVQVQGDSSIIVKKNTVQPIKSDKKK